jgi:hypothetical protein
MQGNRSEQNECEENLKAAQSPTRAKSTHDDYSDSGLAFCYPVRLRAYTQPPPLGPFSAHLSQGERRGARRRADSKQKGADFVESAPLMRFARSELLSAEVDTDVEATVIPVALVIGAPTAVGIHTAYVLVNLPAVLAVPGGIPVDPGAIHFESPAAISARIRSNWGPHGQQQTCGQRGGQSHLNP